MRCQVGLLAKPFRIGAIILLGLVGSGLKAHAQMETNLYSFGSSPLDGIDPSAGLVQGNDGNFYGTTQDGGTYSYGTVFRISPSGAYTNLYSFGSSFTDGNGPVAGLVQGSDGNFYGTTQYGGLTGVGTVFRISPIGAYTNLYSFGYSPDGFNPYAELVQGSDSNFYGTTYFGGLRGVGTVFRITPSGVYTNLYSFGGSPADGNFPAAGLVQGDDGRFYGTTQDGGTYGYGTVFRISPSGAYTNLYSFGGSPTDGNDLVAWLVQGSDDNFYGTTFGGGMYSSGTVFRISPTGAYTNLYSFGSSLTDGSGPVAGLVQGSDDNFYGTTFGGGTYGSGTVFQISPSGAYTNLYSFGSSFADGNSPVSGPVQGSDGNFYGTTKKGGTNDEGTVFAFDMGLGPVTNNCKFSINSATAAFGAAGGSGSVKVTGPNGCAWTAISYDSFIAITSGSGGSGDGTVDYTVAANTSTSTLTGTMAIAGQAFTVTQSSLSAETASITVQANPSNGGTVSGGGIYPIGASVRIFASANSGWEFTGWSDMGAQTHDITVPTGGATFTANFTSTSNVTALITVQANPSNGGTVSGGGIYPIGASVRIFASANSGWEFTGWSDNGAQTHDITVPADGAAFTANFTSMSNSCAYSLNATNVTLPAKGGSKKVSVRVKDNDCAWTAVSNDPFITITAGSSGTGNGKVDYTVPGNTNTTALSGTMTIAGQTFTVNQAAGGCTFKLSPKGGKFAAAGGAGAVKLTPDLSDCDWTAVSNDSFITITGTTSGSGPGTVAYSLSANASTDELTGSITIGGETFTVTQAGVK
jgi:uncharacterized repeat protein (TIGR03803 family)